MQNPDYEELGMALAYLMGALPSEPRWIALVTVSGKLVSHYRGKGEAQRIAELIAATKDTIRQLVRDTGGGDFSYSIHTGSDGVFLMMLVSHDYWVGVSLPQVKSLDAVIRGMHEGSAPLKDMLA